MNYDYHDVREREYKILIGQLNSRDIRLERKLFVAVLNAITNIEWLGWTKQHAIKSSAKQQGVTQKSINDVLKQIKYKTPRQLKNEYKIPKAKKVQDFEKELERHS